MNFKILNTFGEKFADDAKQILNKLGTVNSQTVTQEEFLNMVNQYEIVIVGITPVVNKSVIDKAKNLKAVVVPANTLENIDVEYAESKSVEIISLWGETEFLDTITGTSELACGLMIDIMRFTPWAFDSVRKNEWQRERFRGSNLYGKTLGIFGMGRLGSNMARYGKAFRMNVIFYSPHTSKSPVDGCSKVSFDELLKESDVISLHAHLNKETESMFDKSAFEKMKKGAYLINTARGKIVDEGALLNALEKKEIAGYAADVLADELDFNTQYFAKYPLIEYAKNNTNVIVVPHIGGMTHESRDNTDIYVSKKLETFLKN